MEKDIYMKTLILFASKHGCTEKCATKLRDQLSADVDLVNIKNLKSVKFDDYQTVIVGGSIHAGQIQKKVKAFCIKNTNMLKTKKLGLFICCMDGDKAQQQFADAFPDELVEHATATGVLGGAFDFERMNFFERAIVKKVANVTESVSKIFEEKIQDFAGKMKN